MGTTHSFLLTETIHTSDELLFLQVAEGDEAAFTVLYARYTPKLARFVDSLIKSPAITEEIVQETFLRLWLNRAKMPEVLAPSAWIYKIASNICFTSLKRIMLEKHIVAKLPAEAPSMQSDLFNNIQTKELLKFVHEAVSQLSPQRRKIYQLSRNEGLSVSEIAENLSLSVQTVRNTLSSALEQLRLSVVQSGYVMGIALIFFIIP